MTVPTQIWRGLPALLIAALALPLAGCDKPKKTGVSGAHVKVQNIPAKIAWTSGKTTIEVVVEDMKGFRVKADDLLKLITAEKEPQTGMAPGDKAALMVINKQVNEARYWALSEQVKSVRLTQEKASGVELKVLSQSPLRAELWLESPKDVEIVVEMKE